MTIESAQSPRAPSVIRPQREPCPSGAPPGGSTGGEAVRTRRWDAILSSVRHARRDPGPLRRSSKHPSPRPILWLDGAARQAPPRCNEQACTRTIPEAEQAAKGS